MKEKFLKFLELIKSIFSRKNPNRYTKDGVEYTTDPEDIERPTELPKVVVFSEDEMKKLNDIEDLILKEKVLSNVEMNISDDGKTLNIYCAPIQEAEHIDIIINIDESLSKDYSSVDTVQYDVHLNDLPLKDTIYIDSKLCEIEVPVEDVNVLVDEINKLTENTTKYEPEVQVAIDKVNGMVDGGWENLDPEIKEKMNAAANETFLQIKKPKKKPLPKADREPVVKKPKAVKSTEVKTTRMKKEDKVGLEPKAKKPRTTKAKDGAVKSAD